MFSVSWLFRPLFCKVASPTAGDGLHACLSATVVQDPLAYFSVSKKTEAKHCEGCQHVVCSPGSSVGKAHLTGCSNHSKQSCQVHKNSSMGPLSVLVVLILLPSSSKPVIRWWEESARKCFGNLWWALAAPGLSWNKAFNTKHYQSRQRFLIWTFHSKKWYLPFLLFIVNLAAWTLGTKEAMIGDRTYSILLLIAREWLWIISPLI